MAGNRIWPFKRSKHERFEEMVKPHLKQLYRLAYRFTGQKHDAEDLVQNVLLKLYPKLAEMERVESLAPWLNTVLYRNYIDSIRSQKRSLISSLNDEDDLYASYADESPGPQQLLEMNLSINCLQKAVNNLNEDQRIVYILHDVEGYSLSEISEIVDSPIGTLKSRLNRTREKLYESMKKMEPLYDEKREIRVAR